MDLPIQHCTAVLVDNNSFQRKLLRSLLRSSGFSRVSELDSIEAGISEANRSNPDFLFLDYDTALTSDLMRGCDSIKGSFLKYQTHVIILMQNATRPRVDNAIGFGANWVVSRPFSPKCLNRRIRAVLDPGIATKINLTAMAAAESELADPSLEPDITAITGQMDDLLKQSKYYSPKDPKPKAKPKTKSKQNSQDDEEEDVFLL